MLVVLFTAVALLGGAAYYYSRFAVENLGNQVLMQVSARVGQHIQQALDVAEDEAVAVEDLIARGFASRSWRIVVRIRSPRARVLLSSIAAALLAVDLETSAYPWAGTPRSPGVLRCLVAPFDTCFRRRGSCAELDDWQS
jgi:hypothetical protein